MFPGYVFMVTDEADRLGDELLRIKGQTKLLEMDDRVLSLSKAEEDFLKAFGGKEQTIEMSEGVIERSKVRVYSGPLVGKERYICKIDRHKRRAFIELPMLGQRRRIQVGLEIVSKT